MTFDFDLMFRRRAKLEDSYLELFEGDMQKFKALESPWGMDSSLEPILPSFKYWETDLVLRLRKFNSSGYKAMLKYSPRSPSYHRDDAIFDDWVSLEYKSKNLKYNDIVTNGFLQYVETMKTYRASLYRRDSCSVEPDLRRAWNTTKRDIDGRDGIYTICPANFWDELLCQRSYGKSAEQLAQLLDGKVRHVQLVHGGIYFYHFNDWPTLDESKEYQQYVKSILGRGY
jgi:hypothetical protein